MDYIYPALIAMSKPFLLNEKSIEDSDQKPSQRNCDVLFAYMPYHRLSHPALGASILKNCLENIGIKTKINYYGLTFAERIGIKRYELLLNSNGIQLKAEWTFADAAFGKGFLDKQENIVGRPYLWADEYIGNVARQAIDWIDEVADEIVQLNPRILICSSMFQQNLSSLAILRAVKHRSPKIFTIMGGPNTESILGIALLRRAPWLDYICSGEGEETLPMLCKSILNGSKLEQELSGVTSQLELHKYEGLINVRVPRPSLSTLDKSPIPLFDDFFEAIQRSSISMDPGLLLETSRGCWWGQKSQCTFCGLNGDGISYRSKSPTQMASIVKELTLKHGINKIEFVDNIIDKTYFNDFLPLLEDQDLIMFYETKADISEQDISHFRSSGVRFIQPGIESLSNPVLKLMRKGTSLAINLQCLRLCREYGVRPAWAILTGFPGEEENWYKETENLLPMLFHLRPPNGFIPIRYDRFSPYHDKQEEWGLKLEPFEAYLHVYPDYQGQHDDITYFFKKQGRDELIDDGLGIWGKYHHQCAKLVQKWRKFWLSRYKDGAPQPSLRLHLHQDNSFSVEDDRDPNSNPVVYNINADMSELLQYTRKYCSKSILLRIIGMNNIASSNQLDDLLVEAISNGWIIESGNQCISLVQIYNNHELPLTHWPGGNIKMSP